MPVIRIILVLILALAVSPVQGQSHFAAPLVQHCADQSKSGCPCQQSQIPCTSQNCDLFCASISVLGLMAAEMGRPDADLYEHVGAVQQSQPHPDADPPVPRA